MSLNKSDACFQIARLLNSYNRLTKKYNASKIQMSKARYIYYVKNSMVVGTIAIDKDNYIMTRIKHLSVHKDYRKVGIGRKLLRKALNEINSKFSYATIRQENKSSINLFLSEGFKIVNYYKQGEATVLLLVRRM